MHSARHVCFTNRHKRHFVHNFSSTRGAFLVLGLRRICNDAARRTATRRTPHCRLLGVNALEQLWATQAMLPPEPFERHQSAAAAAVAAVEAEHGSVIAAIDTVKSKFPRPASGLLPVGGGSTGSMGARASSAAAVRLGASNGVALGPSPTSPAQPNGPPTRPSTGKLIRLPPSPPRPGSAERLPSLLNAPGSAPEASRLLEEARARNKHLENEVRTVKAAAAQDRAASPRRRRRSRSRSPRSRR